MKHLLDMEWLWMCEHIALGLQLGMGLITSLNDFSAAITKVKGYHH